MTSRTHTISAMALCHVVAMLALAGTAQAQSPLFEVQKSDATRLLQVTDDASFLVGGSKGVGTIPATGAGVRLMWYPNKVAFRAGSVDGPHWDEANVGHYSAAFGQNTEAKGVGAVAMNVGTTASGDNSIALGRGTHAAGVFSLAAGHLTYASGEGSFAVGNASTASGSYAAAFGVKTLASGASSFAAGHDTKAESYGSVATGQETLARGANALAAGFRTQADGNGSVAMGAVAVAAGVASVALGTGVTAQGDGSFTFGDRNAGYHRPAQTNQFVVRAFGGVLLNTGPFIGCELLSGSGTWSCTSSKYVKEDFEKVDGEDILARLREIPIQSWRYIGNPARHIGPFAEDFHAAFGLGSDSSKITQIDADGVALSAVQALERRTAALREENTDLRAEIGELRALNAALRANNAELWADNAALWTRTTELLRRVEALEISGDGR